MMWSAGLDQGQPARLPASPIGATLDLLQSFEKTDPMRGDLLVREREQKGPYYALK